MERYSFKAIWWDKVAEIDREYILHYFPTTPPQIELFDLKNRRLFLRKSAFPDITLDQMVVGRYITIHGRQLKIADFANDFTRQQLASKTQVTCAMVKPNAMPHMISILHLAQQAGLTPVRLKLVHLRMTHASEFYAEHQSRPFFPALTSMMTSEPILAVELAGKDAVAKWRTLLGPTNPEAARNEAPQSIRALYGDNITRNAAHGSANPEDAARELEILFGSSGPAAISAEHRDSTIVVINPKHMEDASSILIDLVKCCSAQGLQFTGIRTVTPCRSEVAELMEAYRGVIHRWKDYVDMLSSGTGIAVEVTGRDAVAKVREWAGPFETMVAKHLAPNSVRARYGVDEVDNAVMVTDLVDDGPLQSAFWFRMN
eukprot:gnl/Dysnectes_brevis/693_a765_3561.p1 GENE.gnl/Dysnectes_brevis/693_a765_3561~~gnl/Dysnectes_brevis/693_a765_3561.p1  ORF type:complete len:373 (-),score=61.04 gnl/Dysnectes_brevis/693_a765_3561:41-1159(-)